MTTATAMLRATAVATATVLRRACLLALLWHGVAHADPLADIERQQQALFETVAPSVVFIATPTGFGSGFFIDDHGTILTNAHVVGVYVAVDVILNDGRKFAGKILERGDHETDLALVRIDAKATPALALVSNADLRVGTWVASVGHGMGGVWAFTTGMISNVYPLGRSRPVFQTQIPVNPGNSGGPIFDRTGQVLGVVTAAVDRSNDMNFAIRVDVACQTLVGLASQCSTLLVTAPPGVPVFVDGKSVGKGPRVLVTAEPRTYDVFVVVEGKMRRKSVVFPAQRSVDLSH